MRLEKIKINIFLGNSGKESRKINKQTKALKRYCDVAYVVDNIRFLHLLRDARQKLGIVTPYSAKDALSRFYLEASKSNESIYNDVQDSISTITATLGLPRNFRRVILYALICNEVPEEAYLSCYFDEINNPAYAFMSHSAIIINPTTNEYDLKRVLKQYKEDLKLSADGNLSYKFDFMENLLDIDTSSEISNYRDYYWLAYGAYINEETDKKLTYGQIVASINKKELAAQSLPDRRLFDTSVKRYYDLCNVNNILIHP